MSIRRKWLWPALALLFTAGLISLPTTGASAAEPVLVGRIAFTEGQILRFVPDNKDWVATVKDAPFGINDALYSDQAGKGEFIMPNGIWARIGGSTQLQLIALKRDVSEMDVASGVARFYNKSSNAMLKVTTPFGHVLADPGSSFDLYVGDQSVEILALDGGVTFIHNNTKYDVKPGSGSIIADATQVASGEGTVDAGWDDWNVGRDSLWTKRVQVKGESVEQLPEPLQNEAYDLEQNGAWENVSYEGEQRRMWRPTHVHADWRPFTVGRWTEWYGDQVWVPDEPFGYVTHHYGNWVIVNGRWFWSPPVRHHRRHHVEVVAPVEEVAWYPGRVAWISGGDDVGWVPLAPRETYYSHRYWGPETVVVESAPAVSIAIGSLAFVAAAIIVPQHSFYHERDYSRVRVTNINQTTIINNYHSAPVVNNTIINNYNTNVNKYNFTTTNVTAKPHVDATQRITRNQQMATQQAPKITAASIKQEVTTAKTLPAPPPPVKQGALTKPQVTSKFVPADKVNAPKDQVKFKPTDMKTSTKPAPTGTSIMKPGVTGTTGRPGVTQPTLPGATTKPGTPGIVPPTGRTLPGQTLPPGATTKPGTPGIVPPGGTTLPTGKTVPGQTLPGATTKPGTPGIVPPTGRTLPGQTLPPGATTKPGTPGIVPPTGKTVPGVQTTLPGGGTRPTPPGAVTQPTLPGGKPGATTLPATPGGVTRPTVPGVQTTLPGGGTRPTPPGVRPGATTLPTPQGGVTRPGQVTPGLTTQPTPTRPGGIPSPRTTVAPGVRPGATTQPTMTPGTVTRPTSPGMTPGTLRTQPPTPTTRPLPGGTMGTQPGIRPTAPTTQPQRTMPQMTQPPRTVPPVTQPRITQPLATQPRMTQPPMTQPRITQPPRTMPQMTQPPRTMPPQTQPRMTQPPRTMPPQTQPRMTQPPRTMPPQTQPRMTQPPRTMPPQTQPRMTQPPRTMPPQTQPPRIQQPAPKPAPAPTPTTQRKKRPGEPGYVPGQ